MYSREEKCEMPQKREWHHMLAGSNYAAGGKNISAVSLQFFKGPVILELFYCLAIQPL